MAQPFIPPKSTTLPINSPTITNTILANFSLFQYCKFNLYISMPPLLQNSIILYPYKICRKTLDLKQNLMRFCNKKTTSSKRKCGFQKRKIYL